MRFQTLPILSSIWEKGGVGNRQGTKKRVVKKLTTKRTPVKNQKRMGSAAAGVDLAAMRRLVAWFDRNQRILPWRESPTLYRVWISEIMLQQTQVATVLPYFERFTSVFPSVEALARAEDAEVMLQWAGLGYYSRARNLHRAAQAIVERGGSDAGFPKTREDWLEIPGVGPYTAGAITSIALNHAEPIVDGNVERVFSRMRRLDRREGDIRYKETLWELSRDAVVRATEKKLSPSSLNQAWMELGATLCSPRRPACRVCPVSGDCEAFQVGDVEAYPPKKKPKLWVEVSERRRAYVDLKLRRIYLEKAPEGKWRAGLWDFPEAAPFGLEKKRRPTDEIGRLETRHVVTQHKISREVIVLGVSSTSPQWRSAPGRWISLLNPEVPLGAASRRGIQAIQERFL